MTMSEIDSQIDPDQRTQIIASEIKLEPTESVYRFMHPIMVCGREDGKFLLRGSKSNGVAVIDNYNSPGALDGVHASSLKDPGLNFTRSFDSHYKDASRRLAVSFRMADQAKGLRIYPDKGSEARSVYFTLPENSFFKVDLKEGDLFEAVIAIKIHELMDKLPMKEEPQYFGWTQSGEGVRIVAYFQKPGEKEQKVTYTFLKNGDSYQMASSFEAEADKTVLETMMIYRLLLEDKNFVEVVAADGSKYKKADLVAALPTDGFSQIEPNDGVYRLLSELGVEKIRTPEDLQKLRKNLLSKLKFLPYNNTTKDAEREIRWKRSGAKVLEDGFVYQGKACTDLVVAFTTLAKAAGIAETRFVKLKNNKTGMVHSVGEFKLGNDWYIFDVANGSAVPVQGEIPKDISWGGPPNGPYLLWKKGRDSWDLGLGESSSISKINVGEPEDDS